MKVSYCKDAFDLLELLKKKHGDIIFYQSFGCCDNSVPICYAKKDFKIGVNDVCLYGDGLIEIYTHKSQENFYKDQKVDIGVSNQRGNEYSLEYELGKSFVFHY